MADLYEPDVGTAFYRSRDPIKNFKLKVCLNRVTSVSIVPQSQVEDELQGAGSQVPLRDVRSAMEEQNFGGQQDREEIIFKWQEKVFSQREVDHYSQQSNCLTVLDKKYHDDTTLQAEVGRPNKRLFSYVDHDSFTNHDENRRQFTTDPDEQPTIIAEKMENMRYRRNAGNKNRKEHAVVPKTNLVDYDPSAEKKKQNHFISSAVQTMYIMADCSPAGESPILEDEVVVCTIKVDSNGILSIKPDFNKGRKAYKVETGGTRGREMFEYTIEHCSTQLTWQEQDRESKMFRELYSRHQEFLAACVGHEFEMPPQDCLRLLVYGEIESATQFEYDDLYITYFIEVPDGWFPNGSQQLIGVTQTCRTKVQGRDNVAYFSFPFNFELVYRSSRILNKESDGVLPRWPQIYFEVASLDSWQRHRVEGYGYVTLPTTPGKSQHSINCWRPVGKSVFSEVRRFFIGGSAELEDPTFLAVPSTFDGTHLSKFGFRTKSTGNIVVNLNVIQQSQSFLQSQASKKKVGTVLDRIGFSAAQANIMNVIEAFQRAKQRMVSARDNLKKDYVETLKAQTDSDD